MEALKRIRGFLAALKAPEEEPEILRPTWKDRLLWLVRLAGIYAAMILVYFVAYRAIMPAQADRLCVQLVGHASVLLAIGALMIGAGLRYLWVGWQVWRRQVMPLPGTRLIYATTVRRGARARLQALGLLFVGTGLLAPIPWLLISEPALRTLFAPCVTCLPV